MNVLKQISDLRIATTAKDKKYQYALHGNAERREARKELRKLSKDESSHDMTIEKKIRDEEQAEMKELMKLKISDTAQPSLLAAAQFLVEDYVTRLPAERCQNCQKTVLPDTPKEEAGRVGARGMALITVCVCVYVCGGRGVCVCVFPSVCVLLCPCWFVCVS